jgi:hypothetical protein
MADADIFIRHRPGELTVNQPARRWSEIRSRLEAIQDGSRR